MTTTEPVDAHAAMRASLAHYAAEYADLDGEWGGADLEPIAAVVQAEQSVGIREALTSLAADVKRIADAYVDATVDAASRKRLDVEDEDRRLARAQRAAENAKRRYDALRAEVERIAGDATMTAYMSNPDAAEAALRALTERLRRALEGGE